MSSNESKQNFGDKQNNTASAGAGAGAGAGADPFVPSLADVDEVLALASAQPPFRRYTAEPAIDHLLRRVDEARDNAAAAKEAWGKSEEALVPNLTGEEATEARKRYDAAGAAYHKACADLAQLEEQLVAQLESPTPEPPRGSPKRRLERRDDEGAPRLKRVTPEEWVAYFSVQGSEATRRRQAFLEAIKQWLEWWINTTRRARSGQTVAPLPEISLPDSTGLINQIARVSIARIQLIGRADSIYPGPFGSVAPFAVIACVQQLVDVIVEALRRNQIPVFYTPDGLGSFQILLGLPAEDAELLLSELTNIGAHNRDEILDFMMRLYDGHQVTSVTRSEGAGAGLVIESEPIVVRTLTEFLAIPHNIAAVQRRDATVGSDGRGGADGELELGAPMPLSALVGGEAMDEEAGAPLRRAPALRRTDPLTPEEIEYQELIKAVFDEQIDAADQLRLIVADHEAKVARGELIDGPDALMRVGAEQRLAEATEHFNQVLEETHGTRTTAFALAAPSTPPATQAAARAALEAGDDDEMDKEEGV
jgi:hypothetical protein